jgi:MSHA biogenesis protein MshI
MSLSIRAMAADDVRDAWPDRVAGVSLGQTPVSAVLPTDAYQLQLVEMPNVPADEVLAAVRWRLKDLIDYSVDEAVVELLEMPRHANPGSAPVAYAVVTRRANVLREIEVMEQADLSLDVIDIPELCIRNIAVELPQDADGVAFLHFTEDCGYLTITRKGVLHLMRRLDTGRRDLRASGDEFSLQERIAGISLEVQRSLDYYESHYDCRPVTEIVLGPGGDLDGLSAALTEHLGLAVNQIDLGDLFELDGDVSAEDQGSCLLAIGAALRSEQTVAQAATT